MGIVVQIDLEEQEVTVQFSERQVSYDYADLDKIYAGMERFNP
jgi:exodeoxyribonuclease V alpha subunit